MKLLTRLNIMNWFKDLMLLVVLNSLTQEAVIQRSNILKKKHLIIVT